MSDDRTGVGLHIVHLAFEDHRQPGSGGGGLRTHEIDKRLARRHRVTVVTAPYPGATRRMEDGVHYRPLGLNLGHAGSLLSYHLALPLYLLLSSECRRADLIVEDFAAPMSSALVPLWTRRPTVAVVQWLFAREKSRHYHLPLFVFEELGLRMHRHFVAVSEYIGERIRCANAEAQVRVVPGGVAAPSELGYSGTGTGTATGTGTGTSTGSGDSGSGDSGSVPGSGRVPVRVQGGRVLYLGRLEWGHKGLDLLVETFAQLAAKRHDAHLVVAGDGRDEDRLRAEMSARDLADRVQFLGRVEGREKWEELCAASVLVVPSRYETFGLVAAEALVAGTPVVAFDLPSLREIVAPGCGLLVPRGDTRALADALESVLADPALRLEMARSARLQAGRFDWEAAAAAHDELYRRAAEDVAVSGPRLALGGYR